MQKINIKPTNNLLVRDPESRQALDIKGEEKLRTSYWIRRINDGSVTLIDKLKTQKAQA